STLLIFVLTSISFASYTDEAFAELVKAIREKSTKAKLLEVEEKYKNKRIEGKGYITSITSDVDDNIVINLSTEERASSPEAVITVLILRKYLRRQASRFEIGRKMRFFGVFKEIRMNSIVVEEGFAKEHH
ncbi:MAG: hypothetical protein JW867_05055, partial [Candidatus Omnitrophica bacterium]|nr:hypothetical protein [Candidatus Omnitrophota bacterium]